MRVLPSVLRAFRRAPAPIDWPAPAPARDLYVVGDVHGCRDALEQLLRRIDADVLARRGEGPVPRLVFVGDYVDRGPDSAGVLGLVHQLATTCAGAVVCLRGNHEEMLLDFLDDPQGRGARWLSHGGLDTLASFGLAGGRVRRDPLALRDALRTRLAPGLEDWLRACPLSWNSGNVWVVHAGAFPARAMTDQPARALLWGAPRFLDTPRQDGAWIVHGHTRTAEPAVVPGRIAVDTGAGKGGRLSAAILRRGGEVGFLTVG